MFVVDLFCDSRPRRTLYPRRFLRLQARPAGQISISMDSSTDDTKGIVSGKSPSLGGNMLKGKIRCRGSGAGIGIVEKGDFCE